MKEYIKLSIAAFILIAIYTTLAFQALCLERQKRHTDILEQRCDSLQQQIDFIVE